MKQDIELLRDLVSIYSPSTQEQAASTFLVEAMHTREYDAAFVDEAGNAVGIWGTGPQEIVLLGPSTRSRVFPVRQDGDILYGLGSADETPGVFCSRRISPPEKCQLSLCGARSC